MLANSKLARQIDSRAFNPSYTFTAEMEEFSIGEVIAPIIAFGDIATGAVEKKLVEYFFGESKITSISGLLHKSPDTGFLREREAADRAWMERQGGQGYAGGYSGGIRDGPQRHQPYHRLGGD